MDFCDFLAEDELIEIVPNFNHEQNLKLIKGDFGPFIPGVPTKVPLWMALNLFRQQKCKISLPQWITDMDILIKEQSESEGLIKIPSDHWREVIKLLESHNVHMPHDHNALIESREAILKKSIGSLLDEIVGLEEGDKIADVKLRNITKFELASFKNKITTNLEFIKELK